ncbi:TOBE domain protein [Chloroherpeton thalassium ATCC 35110]|uniref:TOBE domain protein n=1 Tax=Chloroherpeton thalassium (strain ATCC 35110 / GB-78) TaxID=517418 RepID=B3QUW7_CHLT3|nr:TOBE domain-containing protein [Chloroherpeton thalassium]ACF14468.1 TOBE domain protein [Chloroherpeton thalassium ATCC 35110]
MTEDTEFLQTIEIWPLPPIEKRTIPTLNRIKGYIAKIDSAAGISLVDVATGAGILTVLILDTPKSLSYLKEAHPVHLLFKETEVAIAAPEIDKVSYSNVMDGIIEDILLGELLAEVTIAAEKETIRSIITKRAYRYLGLAKGKAVKWITKADEIVFEVAVRD